MIKEKIKSLVKKKTSGDNKKTLENLIVFLVLLIITVIAINIIWGKENNNEKQIKKSTLLRVSVNHVFNNKRYGSNLWIFIWSHAGKSSKYSL